MSNTHFDRFRINILCVLSSLALMCNKDEPVLPSNNLISEDSYPASSRDGKWIAYHHYDYQGDTSYPTGLYVVDSSGLQRHLVVAGPASTPSWSPDADRIAFCSGQIYSIARNGDSIQALTQFSGFFPSWSPDGSRVAFDSPYGDAHGANVIWVVNADGSNPHDISKHGVGEWRMPDWSPDGLHLVYEKYIDVPEPEIAVMDSSGQSSVRLTSDRRWDVHPHYSADGKLIIWTRDGGEIWLMNSDGSSKHKVTNAESGIFLGKSTRIIAVSRNNSKNRNVLWEIDQTGAFIKQITY